jgi:hypothetical protein
MLVENKRGNYSFLKATLPYSAGVVADPGFEIVRVRIQPAPELPFAFALIERAMQRMGRPIHALCGIELRSPRPFSVEGFFDFNAVYASVLNRWDILRDGINPVARTNVAPEYEPPAEPLLYAFSYTAVSAADAPRTFVIAGAGELPEGSLDPAEIVRVGETSPEALREKARFVIGLMNSRLQALGVSWQGVTASNVYTAHNIFPLLRPELLARMGTAALHGLTWHYARPPLENVEFEMDARGCRLEVVITE